jgi:hypothetical protein
MSKTLYLAILAALPAALAVGWGLGGSVGAGAALGGALGVALSLGGLAWQEHALARRPQHAMLALVATFLAKLVALAGGALVLRFAEGPAARFDWTSYLLAFAAAVLWSMAISSLRALRSTRRRVGTEELRA